jgi:hypothetical protein
LIDFMEVRVPTEVGPALLKTHSNQKIFGSAAIAG